MVSPDTPALPIDVHPLRLQNTIRGTHTGLTMTGVQAEPVGVSRYPSSRHAYSVIIGLLGDHAGSLTINLSERAVLLFYGALLGEEAPELTEEALDAVGEVGNMVAGALKDSLEGSELAFQNISCPTVVMGQSYYFHYAAGFRTCSVSFEVAEIPVVHMTDRIFTVSVSMMKR